MKRLALFLLVILSALALAEGNTEVSAVSTSVNSATSAKLSVGYKLVVCTVATHYRTGPSTVVSATTDLSIPANTPWQVFIRPADRYIAFILDSGTGSCSIYFQVGDGKNPPPEHASPGLDPFTATTANISGDLSVGGNVVSGGTVSGGFDGGVGRFSAAYISGTLGLAGRATLGGAMWALEVDAGTVNAGSANVTNALSAGGDIGSGGLISGILDAGSARIGDLNVGDNGITVSGTVIGESDYKTQANVAIDRQLRLFPNTSGAFDNGYASFQFASNGTGLASVVPWGTLSFTVGTTDAGSFSFAGGPFGVNDVATFGSAASIPVVDAGVVSLQLYSSTGESCVAGVVGKTVRVASDGGSIVYTCADLRTRLAWVQMGGGHSCVTVPNMGLSTAKGETFGGFHADYPGFIVGIDVYATSNGTGGGQAHWTATQNWDGGSYNLCTGYSPCSSGAGGLPSVNTCGSYYTSEVYGGSTIYVGYDGGCTTPPQANVYVYKDRSVQTLSF